jgi:type IV secretory pathway VirB2 component (pilin)
VSEWSLAIIAAATAVMALIQIGAIIVLARVATQVRDTVATIQQDIRPLIARATALADEASRAATLATAQMQKVDKLVTDLTRRVDETAAIVQEAVVTPAREGMAILAAVKAGLAALRGMRDLRRRAGGVEDEDALFIG